MGITNIHHAEQVLCRANMTMADQAYIACFRQPVLLVGRSFAQEEIVELSDYLRSPYRDMWVQKKTDGSLQPIGVNVGSLSTPTLHTTPGVYDDPSLYEFNSNGPPDNLAYIIIVRGSCGALYSKVRTFYSIFAVAAAMLEEAVAGLTVAFSCALLKKDVPRLTEAKIKFAKVPNVKDLLTEANEGYDSIRLCC
jgi:hypothetical protein